MNIQDSRSKCVARMHRVLAYIDKHLGEPIELAQLAVVACKPVTSNARFVFLLWRFN
jgi:hypothetical protein